VDEKKAGEERMYLKNSGVCLPEFSWHKKKKQRPIEEKKGGRNEDGMKEADLRKRKTIVAPPQPDPPVQPPFIQSVY